MNTYKKMKCGVWGMRLEGEISTGERVTVTKKDGRAKEEVVGKILWQGQTAAGLLVSFAYIERNNIRLARAQRSNASGAAAARPEAPRFIPSAPVARTRDALALVQAYQDARSARAERAALRGGPDYQDMEAMEGRRHDQ